MILFFEKSQESRVMDVFGAGHLHPLPTSAVVNSKSRLRFMITSCSLGLTCCSSQYFFQSSKMKMHFFWRGQIKLDEMWEMRPSGKTIWLPLENPSKQRELGTLELKSSLFAQPSTSSQLKNNPTLIFS